MQESHCSYYGSMEYKKPYKSVEVFLVEAIYRKMLDKHEKELIKDQSVLIDDLKKTFAFEIKQFTQAIKGLESILAKMEKLAEKESKNAISV